MQITENKFKQAIKTGEKQIGLWVTLGSGFTADIIASTGFDWVVVDMEHSPNDIQSVLHQLQVFAASNTTAIVRPDWNDPVEVKRILDIGAQGVLFPMVQTVEEAEAAVASTRYPPHGIRGVSGISRATQFGRIPDYAQKASDEMLVIVQLETKAAIEIADEIAAVDGVDGLFFGPADIAADLGKLGNPMDPAVWDLVRPKAQELIAKGVRLGTLVFDPDFALTLLDEGFTFVACGMDAALLARGADTLLSHVKTGIK